MEDWRLYWSPQSSAALRVVLALRAKGMLPANMPICQPNRAHPTQPRQGLDPCLALWQQLLPGWRPPESGGLPAARPPPHVPDRC